MRKAKRTAYLTELIERHERWQATYRDEKERSDEDARDASPARDSEEEDLWDFGTVRPVGKRNNGTAGLRAMNESGMNSRSSHAPSSPTKRSVSNKENAYSEEEETTRRGTVKGNMAPPPLPKTPSPSKKSQPLQSPAAAAKVPLPSSPTRKPVQQHQTPPQSRPEQPSASPHPPETPKTPGLLNDDFLQQSIASDMSKYMKGLAIQDKPITAPKLQDQPTFAPASKGLDSQIAPQAPTQAQASTTQDHTSTNELFQKPLPDFAPRENNTKSEPQQGARDSPARSSLDSARSDTSTSGQNFPVESTQTSQEQPVTALTSVVLPALEAALHRRSYQLALQQKKQSASQTSRNPTSVNGLNAEPDMLLKRQTHDQVRKCMSKVSRLFKEIDHWDGVAPVGMGDGVEGLLEGFLEEILCRVEAEDA